MTRIYILQSLKDRILDVVIEEHLKRDTNGNVYHRIDGLSYAYEMYEGGPKDFLRKIFYDDDDFSSDPYNIDRLVEFLQSPDTFEFPYLERSQYHLGFANGVFDIISCRFTTVRNVDPTLIVRKYTPVILDMGNLDTPLFDTIIDNQYARGSGIYEIFLMCIGRLFFPLGQRDDWKFIPYLHGHGHTGKHTIVNVIRAMFTRYGIALPTNVTDAEFASHAEVVITDRLYSRMTDIVPLHIFRSLANGGLITGRTTNEEMNFVNWRVPVFITSGFPPNYRDQSINQSIVKFNFPYQVYNLNPYYGSMIIEKELAQLMVKCLQMYKRYSETYHQETSKNFLSRYVF